MTHLKANGIRETESGMSRTCPRPKKNLGSCSRAKGEDYFWAACAKGQFTVRPWGPTSPGSYVLVEDALYMGFYENQFKIDAEEISKHYFLKP